MILQCFGGPANGRVVEIPDGGWDVHFLHRYGADTYVVRKVALCGEVYWVAVWEYATDHSILWRLDAIHRMLRFLCGWNLVEDMA